MFKKCLSVLLFVLLISVTAPVLKTEASSYGVVENGTNRTLVPLRMVAETFSVPVEWDNVSKTVTIDKKYKLTMGSKMIKDGATVIKKMDTQPKMLQNSVYVPVREVAYLFNVPMNWDQVKKMISYQVGAHTYKVSVYPESTINKPKVSVTKKSMNAGGKNISVNVVNVNLLAPNTSLHVELAKNQLGSVASLSSIAKAHNAKVAMNGNYFDAYSNNSYRTVYNGLVMNGERVKVFDAKFSVFYVLKDGDVGILPGAKFMELFNEGNVQEAFQVGPRLVTNSAVTVDPIAEGFSSHKILSSPGARSAIGILPNRQLVFVTTSGATVQQLASVLKQMGAVDAMNSDGGASSGLFVNGSYLTTPGRDIAVALLVK
ncbi:copper amine oxidase [Lysinibacillus sp. 2017]|uniref:phosphodiester glycosidase family protein n=1 Tax=unclassified Lysinibacillus TaxID=2636778 RepID=UPI000D527432|nr:MULTISPECIES: phosphodiester glycosidase family protein [unclassified Lysinibacillus]AWE06348.1 copper amine oxidase [Lysinibacillus sp. 2017]TGN29923.1 copper amine oxidase [Lysinibacillus sp. S2017]